MRTAVVQLSSQENVGKNLSQLVQVVRDAAQAGAQLILLPEAFAYLGADSGRTKYAEQLGRTGPIQSCVADLCRAWGIYIIAGGLPELSSEPERPYNSSVVFNGQGRVEAVYRKNHLFDVNVPGGACFEESKTTCRGSDNTLADVMDWKVGLSICYDLRFPEQYAWQRKNGAQILTVPAAFTQVTGEAHWEILLRARAIETQSYVLAAGQEGVHALGRRTFGHSMIVDPWGRIVAECTEPGIGFALAELELSEIEKVRSQMPLRS